MQEFFIDGQIFHGTIEEFDAITDFSRWKEVKLNGQLHRIGGPALIRFNGSKYWFKNGKVHRDDGGPAEIWADGFKAWRQDGKLIKVENPSGNAQS